MKKLEKLKTWLSTDWKETKILFKSVPAIPFALLCAALIAMNFLANKTIVNESWIGIDAGIMVSWIAFLAGDMIVKRFGPKAALKVNLAAVGVQLVAVALFAIGGLMPRGRNALYSPEDFVWAANIDGLFKGSLWPLAAGTAAFVAGISADVFLNWAIFKRFKNKHSFKAYAVSSYASTMVAQFVDNVVFGLLFTVLAGYMKLSAVWMFAAVGAIVELLCQDVRSPVGYRISETWRKERIGQEYIDLVKEAQKANESVEVA